MTLLATLFPHYVEGEFDVEVAWESPKRLVLNWEQARNWAEAELHEGRDDSIEWEYTEVVRGGRLIVFWRTECNEQGSPEEWFLVVEDVPFVKIG